MKENDINRIMGISESYELPYKIMQIILNEDEMKKILDKFMELGEDLESDWFTEYFEEQHANKTKMAQDFTPKEICDLAAYILGEHEIVADICAGTGGLTIGVWNRKPSTRFICYEYSKRAVPILLLNMAIRNICAWVVRADLLTGEIFETYYVAQGIKYGRVEITSEIPDRVDGIISNPPYSMKYDIEKDSRNLWHKEILPSRPADYVFMAFALTILKPEGKAVFILSHGVLFRGNKEKKFREILIEMKYLKTVLGLPGSTFINTDIPTLIMELDTKGENNGILFIDAAKEGKKHGKRNIIESEAYEKICRTYDTRRSVERFATLCSYEQIRENDYNLNIPRYVDTYEPEKLPELEVTLHELGELENKLYTQMREFLEMTKELEGMSTEEDRKLKNAIRNYKKALSAEAEEYKQEVLKL